MYGKYEMVPLCDFIRIQWELRYRNVVCGNQTHMFALVYYGVAVAKFLAW